MNKIIYNSEDDILLIDDVPYVGGFFKPDNVWGIVWNSPDNLWMEFRDGTTETCKGAYPHPEHVDQWNTYNVKAMDDARLAEEEDLKRQEEFEEQQAKKEEIIQTLKNKMGLVFEASGYCLDTNELHVMFGEELE